MERKTAVVLGGSSGIGKAVASRFAREGYRVLVGSSDREKGEAVCAGLPGEGHRAFEVDVRREDHLQAFAAWIAGVCSGLDVLVNSVGVSQGMPVLESEFEKWDNALQVMLYGTVKSCRLLVPLIKDHGRVIHITSIHHERVEMGSSAYGMAKAAVTQFTRSLALELAPRGILANTVAPGFIDTPMSVKGDGRNELETEWFYDNYVKYNHLPLRRAGQPEEVAGAVFFLAGPDATYVTGSVMTVDGGLTVTF